MPSPHDREMPTRPLGRTGVRVSAVGLGGSHIGKSHLSRRDAIAIIRAAIDGGLTFMDNSWDYNGGESEIRMGKALRDGYRHKAFVMTKVDGRTRAAAAKQLDESLRRLELDSIDLLQHHEVIRLDDVDRIFDEGGAMEALIEARQAGKIRFIGFTGHKDPAVHLYMLQKAEAANVRFDAVQLPLNVMDAHFRSFERQVLPVLVAEGFGVLGMKSMGSGVFLKSKLIAPLECLQYALRLPASTVIAGIDSMAILDQAFEAARTFADLDDAQVSGLLARTALLARFGEFELFKTSSHFDSTARNPEWLGEDSKRVRELTRDDSR